MVQVSAAVFPHIRLAREEKVLKLHGNGNEYCAVDKNVNLKLLSASDANREKKLLLLPLGQVNHKELEHLTESQSITARRSTKCTVLLRFLHGIVIGKQIMISFEVFIGAVSML